MKFLTGEIIALKTAKTATVAVTRITKHPLYQKQVKSLKKYKVHYDTEKLQVGDKVKITQTRPISKDKHFRINEVVKI